MEASLNQILYGPPGTGKTYTLKEKYFERYTSAETLSNSRKAFRKRGSKSLMVWRKLSSIALLELKKAKVSSIRRTPLGS